MLIKTYISSILSKSLLKRNSGLRYKLINVSVYKKDNIFSKNKNETF